MANVSGLNKTALLWSNHFFQQQQDNWIFMFSMLRWFASPSWRKISNNQIRDQYKNDVKKITTFKNVHVQLLQKDKFDYINT